MGVSLSQSEIEAKVQQELDLLQPYIMSHGGKITLLRVKDNQIFVKLEGTCTTCPLSFYTLTFGLEKKLKSSISPSIAVIVED